MYYPKNIFSDRNIISKMFQTLNINIETGEYQFTSPEGQLSEVPFPELPMKISRVNPYNPVKFDANIAVDVAALPMSAKMSKGRIDSMFVGPPEDYRAQIGLYDEGSLRSPCGPNTKMESGESSSSSLVVTP